MDKLWLIELMNMPYIGIVEELPLLNAFALLNQYGNVNVSSDNKGNITYECNVNDVIDNGITEDIIIKLNQNGWSLNEDNSKIIKKI